jgi:NAD(P)-dependent dehydrogenase (short-subunit alcohol dehydrogenase family)
MQMAEISSENFAKIIDVNVLGTARAIEAFLPLFRRQGSGIIAGVGSLSDCRGLPGSAAYTSSKIAVSHLLEAARIELKPLGIRVVTIKPGFVRTNMTAHHTFKMPFIIDPDIAAKVIANGIARGKNRVYFPKIIAFGAYIARALPSAIYEGLTRFRWRQPL